MFKTRKRLDAVECVQSAHSSELNELFRIIYGYRKQEPNGLCVEVERLLTKFNALEAYLSIEFIPTETVETEPVYKKQSRKRKDTKSAKDLL